MIIYKIPYGDEWIRHRDGCQGDAAVCQITLHTCYPCLSVCLSVCVSVRLPTSKSISTDFTKFSVHVTCYMWPWLFLPLTTVQSANCYVFLFFVDDVMFSHNGANRPESNVMFRNSASGTKLLSTNALLTEKLTSSWRSVGRINEVALLRDRLAL